ncbi:ECF transporter S component [Mycoplasma sp. P36-A1]|uniref:ECF transporter S component n=1 Tax=Mycoplasma sp. P36-A1 TaxID=3252900 RepID=UPI003C2D769A
MKTRDITIVGLLIAISFILANIKIMGSIALDSAPAMLAVFLYKDYKGAIIAMFGHILSAALAGFPLTLPVHIVIMLSMGLMMAFSSLIYKKTNSIIITVIFMFIFNTFISPAAMFIVVPFDPAVYTVLLIPLGQATIANIAIALLVLKPIKKAMIINV